MRQAQRDSGGGGVQTLSALLYTDDGLLYSPRPARIQAALDVMTVIFDHAGIQTNVDNTVGLTCQPWKFSGFLSFFSYMWNINGVFPSYW